MRDGRVQDWVRVACRLLGNRFFQIIQRAFKRGQTPKRSPILGVCIRIPPSGIVASPSYVTDRLTTVFRTTLELEPSVPLIVIL